MGTAAGTPSRVDTGQGFSLTIMGAWVDAGQRAVVWADTECVYRSGRSAGHANKLTVNVAAGLACVSGGWGDLAQAAAAVASDEPTFDEVMDAMPSRLRVQAAKCVDDGRDPRDFSCQTTIIAGYSARYGCVVAFEFTGSAYFAPIIVSRAAYPEVDGVMVLNSPGDVVDVARRQAADYRQDWPAIGCGRLTIAQVERGRVMCHAPYDLTGDAWLPAHAPLGLEQPDRLAAMLPPGAPA